jgi:hypothetical protein
MLEEHEERMSKLLRPEWARGTEEKGDLMSVFEDFRIDILQDGIAEVGFVVQAWRGVLSVDVEEAGEEESAFWQDRSVVSHEFHKFLWVFMDKSHVAVTPSKVIGGKIEAKMLTRVVCHAFNLIFLGPNPEHQPCHCLQHFLNPSQLLFEVVSEHEAGEIIQHLLVFSGSSQGPQVYWWSSDASYIIRSRVESSNMAR